MSAFLSLENIRQQFGGVRALDGVSLTIHPGEIHCLAGENGSGKSTLIKVISGVNRPQAGQIVIGDRTYPCLTPMESIRLGIQVIYQDLALFPNLSVAENLVLNELVERRCQFVRWSAVRARAREGMRNLDLDLDLDQPVGELPVAQRQLVAIARSLLHDAKLIVMDEPTSALTGVEIERLLRVMGRLKDEGIAILFVSHKLREMRAKSDQFTVLRNGRVVVSGPASEFDEVALGRHMTGRRLDAPLAPLVRSAAAESLLEVKDLCGPMLQNVNLEVRTGEIVGLTGLLGSGQAELAQALFGLKPATSGSITVRGERRWIRSPQEAIAAGIAYVPEDRLSEGLFLEQSVELNTVAADFGPVQGRGGLVSLSALSLHAGRWLGELEVPTARGRAPVSTLSGGNQQRVMLARWLATKPDILVLNGPTMGVDVGSKEGLHRKLRELARQGMGILMISDDLLELAENCGRILILHQGRIVADQVGGDSIALAQQLNQFA